MTLTIRESCATNLTTELAIDEVMFEGRTSFQHILLTRTSFGRTLCMDHNTQSSDADEGLYHAALVHPPLFSHPNPKRVLIGGGGEGATLRDVLRHPQVEKCTMVDIDEEAVQIFKEHLPDWSDGAFDSPRADVRFGDVRAYLKECQPDSFDVILLDCSDPIVDGPSALIFTQEFFQLCARALAPGGILAGQIGEWDIETGGNNYRAMYTTIGQAFSHRIAYRIPMPVFGTSWGFILASKQAIPPRPEDLQSRFQQADPKVADYYDPEGHSAMLWLPKASKEALEEPGRLLCDADNLAKLG